MTQENAESREPQDTHLPTVVDTPQAGAIVPLRQTMAGPRDDYWASWPVATAADRVAVYNARNREAGKLEAHLNQTILVRGVIAHHAEIESETGELQTCVRCIFLLVDGNTIACVSGGVVQSVRDLITNLGEGPWEPPLPIIPRQLSTRKGHRLYKLELDSSYLSKQPGSTNATGSKAKAK